MQLVKPDGPILRKVCRADFTVTMRDIMQMFVMLQDTKGLGLAAPQVGIDARLFITVWGEVFVNPRVVEIDGPVRSTEGCLSLPGITAQVDRWDKIRLADGRAYAGERAVVILHEIDHMNGVLITDFPQPKCIPRVCTHATTCHAAARPASVGVLYAESPDPCAEAYPAL